MKVFFWAKVKVYKHELTTVLIHGLYMKQLANFIAQTTHSLGIYF